MQSERHGARYIMFFIIALLIIFAAFQLVPYGRDHSNPPVSQEPRWDSPETRELFFRACKNCHSNETEWPWYSTIAPISWLVQGDVDEGRSNFNISATSGYEENGNRAAEMVRKRKMPPWYYLPAHSEARLSESEHEELIRGLAATFSNQQQTETPR